MANLNVRIKDKQGNIILPTTKASLVINNSSEDLGNVQANAEVNVISEIKVDDVTQTVTDKTVNIHLPDYSLSKQTVPDTGYAETFFLNKDETGAGQKINIPRVASPWVLVNQVAVSGADIGADEMVSVDLGSLFTDLTKLHKIYLSMILKDSSDKKTKNPVFLTVNTDFMQGETAFIHTHTITRGVAVFPVLTYNGVINFYNRGGRTANIETLVVIAKSEVV